MLICDEFSTYLHSIAMKTKSNSDIILALTSLVSYFKQYGYEIKSIHSDHETARISATTFLNQQGIQYQTIAPYQHEQKLERYVQTINARFRSVLSSLKFKLPNKLYPQLFTAIQQYIYILPNSVHPTLTPSSSRVTSLISVLNLPFPLGLSLPFIMQKESPTSMSLIQKMAFFYISPTIPLITLLLGFLAETQ